MPFDSPRLRPVTPALESITEVRLWRVADVQTKVSLLEGGETVAACLEDRTFRLGTVVAVRPGGVCAHGGSPQRCPSPPTEWCSGTHSRPC